MTDETVAGISVHRGSAETVINAPMEYVTRTMLDYARYSEFMPHVRESRVVRRNRAQTDIYMQVPLTSALGVVWTLMRLTVTQSRDRVELAGQAIDGNTDHFESRSVIERIPGPTPRTRFTFAVLALPRLPFPSSVFTREMRDAARTVANNVIERTERAYALSAIPARNDLRTPAPPATGTASR